jgi:3',5'-cyclic AMP phosphodiesterase CpdA
MAAGSEQERWLRADLAASSAQCTLAIWHHPRFTSGKKHGNITAAGPLWDALYEAGADVVINGHEHSYERLAPQTPAGVADPARGLREFVVGTGGSDLSSFGTPLPTSEARNAAVFGVLQLTLRAGTYSWEFVPVAGASFTDSGTGSCH